jgi:hypothetical protein
MSERFHARAHVTDGELALYVIDALGAARKEAVEQHVLRCEACAEGLAREARVEAAFEQVALLAAAAGRRTEMGHVVAMAPAARGAAGGSAPRVVAIFPPMRSAEARARLVSGGRRSRWAGGVGGALAAAAALVLAFASSTAHSETVGMAQRAPALHDAAGDMSGAFGASVETLSGDALDGG